MVKAYAEESLINECLSEIEKKLAWGSSEQWSNADFEELSSAIRDDTGVMLSLTTLKRVWGKVKYENKPTQTTLNALAGFLGFKNWRSFANRNIQKFTIENSSPDAGTDLTLIPSSGEAVIKQKTTRERSVSLVWILSIVIVGLAFITLFSFYNSGNSRSKLSIINTGKFAFSLDKVVSEGVPNSVVFHYDASAATSDSIFIAQTWDVRRKTPVSKNDRHHSAIYYYPGFFRTKLIVGNTIVKTQDLQINTDGWLVTADNDPAPIYFKKEDFLKDDIVDVDKTILKKYNLSLLPDPPKIRFFNQGDYGNLMNDNFIFETTLKNKSDEGSNICQNVEVLIQCKDDIIIIPLSAKSCIGQLRLYAAGAAIDSKFADLSKFGCDLSQWTNLKVECKDKFMSFYINNNLAYSLTFPHQPTGIVGVQYRFNGPGAVKNASFKNKYKAITLQ